MPLLDVLYPTLIPYRPRALISALGIFPCINSAITFPVPNDRLIPHGPCPAATNTPPSPPDLVETPGPRSLSLNRNTYGYPRSVIGLKHSPVRKTSSSLSEAMNCFAIRFSSSTEASTGFAPVASGGKGMSVEFTPAR